MSEYKENEMVTISIDRFNELIDIKHNFDEKFKELQKDYDEKLSTKEAEFLKILEHNYLVCMDEYDFDRLNRIYTRHDCCRIRGQVYIKISEKEIVAPYLEKINDLTQMLHDATMVINNKKWWQFWK